LYGRILMENLATLSLGGTINNAGAIVINDGANNVFVGAMYNSGLWRYVEP